MTRRVTVWDVPTRVFHWGLVGLTGGLWYTGENGLLETHILCGEAMVALLLFRLMWGVVGSQTARFRDFLRGPAAIRRYLAGQSHGVGHNPLGGWMVLAMLLVLVGQVTTGLFASDVDSMLYDGPLAHWIGGSAETMTAIHQVGIKVILALVALHLAAIVFYRVVKKQALVPAMVTGRAMVDAGHAAPAMAPWWRALLCVALALGAVRVLLVLA